MIGMCKMTGDDKFNIFSYPITYLILLILLIELFDVSINN
jgi:hypothetical protein